MTYQVNCQLEDRFMVETDDEEEAVEHIKQHAREKHDMDLGDEDARGMIQQT